MRHLDEGTIHAWLDGALSPGAAASAETHVASCRSCADAVAEARGLIAASSRILTALDDVPSVKGARGAEGAGGAKWGRRSLATWLVRERIAAVAALVVAGGALATMLSRDSRQTTLVQTVAESVQSPELAAADSPAPDALVVTEPLRDAQKSRTAGRGGIAPLPQAHAKDLAANHVADSAPIAVLDNTARVVVPTGVAAAPTLRTDDTLRSVAVAQARREQAPELGEGKVSLPERLRVLARPGQAAEASARFAEPRAAEANARGVVGAAFGTAEARLLQEERMTESGREVRRRIYRVDDVLVTLDERVPDVVEGERRARVDTYVAPPAAQAAPQDSTPTSTNTIRWTDARGAELRLTGPVSKERLERIKALLGY
jgi:hypothetical protein